MQLPLLPKETVISFLKSVAEEVAGHPDPDSDEELKEKRQLARQIQTIARQQKREMDRQMEQAKQERQEKLGFKGKRTQYRTL